MARNVTITFEDGSSHVYNNVPDDVTPDAITARANSEFKKTPTNIDGGKPIAPEKEPMFSATGLPARAMGAFETGLSTLSGMAAVPAGAAAGIYGTLTSGKYGTQEGIREGEKLARQVQERMTYRPTTEKGQEYTEDVARAFEASKIPPVMAGPMGVVGLGGAGGKTIPTATQYAAGRAVAIPKQTYTGFTGSLGGAEGRLIAKPGTLDKDIPVYQRPSALEPAGNQYIPEPVLEQMRRQEITPEQALEGMQNWTPDQKTALERTRGMVPYADQRWQGVGEILAQPYQSWKTAIPKLLTDVGVPTMAGLYAGGPIGAGIGLASKLGYNALQAIRTGNKIRSAGQLENVGFTRMTDAERMALQQAQQNPQPLAPGPMRPPQTPPPAPQPQGGAPTQAVQTPAAQAAQATTQAKVQQTTGAVAPSGPTYNVPTQPVPQPNVGGFKQPQQPTTTTMPTQGPATPMPMKPMATPVSEPQYTGYKIAEAPTFTKVQKQLEPHANTPLIEKALADKIAANPQLTEFNKPYITPENLKEPIGKFLSNETQSIVAEGGPGTGKTSLGIEWKRQNEQGHLVKITANSLKDSKTLDTILEKLKTQANDKVLFLIDEADTFTKPGKATALKHLNTLKDTAESYGPAVKFLYTTNKIDKIPALAKDVPVVKVDTKLTPQERSAYALKVAQDFNVNKTPAEIEAIANNPKLTNFRDVRTAVSEGYSLKEPPIFTYDKTASKSMPNTPEKVTQALDAFVNNETSRNVIIFDASAYAKDPKLATNLQKYVPQNSSEFILNDLSKNLLEGNTAGGKPIRIVINEKNIDDVRALKSEFETGNEKLHPLNIILEDPNNLLIGKDNLPLRSRAHIIDGSFWNKPKQAVDAKTVDVAKAIQRGEDLGIVKSPKGKPPGVMEIMTKDGPESMYSYKGILDDIEQASHSVMQQNLKNGGKGFNVSYKHGDDFIHETKHNKYHKIEIEHPNGTMTTITKMEGSPHTKYQDTTYMTAKVDETGIPRKQKTLTEKPANWMSVEDEIKKYFGNE